MHIYDKKGATSLSLLIVVAFIVIVLIVLLSLPSISIDLNLFSTAPKLNITQGVAVSSISAPSSVSPSSFFNINMYVSNNINGKAASNINLCLDNVGIFTVTSAQSCIRIPNMFSGSRIPETFSLHTPPNNAYGNIPYTQIIGYYLNYSYSASASQSFEFISQQAYNNGNYPPPSLSSFGNTAGPISIFTSAQQPQIYGSTAQAELILSNVGDGIVLGPVHVSISMDSNQIEVSPDIFGFTTQKYANGTTIFTGSLPISTTTENITIPIVLNPTKESSLSSSGVPYFSANMQISISYSYEVDGFMPVKLNVVNYFVG